LMTHERSRRFHVDGWRTAYDGIMPRAYLASLSIDERERNWQRNLGDRAAANTWVVEESGTVVGWISVGRSRDADAQWSTGEVWAIYVDSGCWRRGLGRLLWRQAEDVARANGFLELTLWVLETNSAAIAFYEAHGCTCESESGKTISIGGDDLREVRFRKSLKG
jgi:ribosomal protein S18 acetylase RimI-like enzyme